MKETLCNCFRHFCRSSLGNAIIISVFILMVILVPLWWQSTSWLEGRLIADARISDQEYLISLEQSLYSSLNQKSATLHDIDRVVRSDPSAADYRDQLAELYTGASRSDPTLQGVRLKPAGKPESAYPMIENTAGSPATTLTLKEPIFIHEQYWGLAVEDINITRLFATIDTAGEQKNHLDIAVIDAEGSCIYGESVVFDRDPVIQHISLPYNISWEVAGVPHSGWSSAVAERLNLFRYLGLAIILLVTLLVALIAYRQISLHRQVCQHTRSLRETKGLLTLERAEHQRADRELETSRIKYFTLFNNTSDIVALCSAGSTDIFKQFIEVNDSMCQIFGYSRKELLELSCFDLSVNNELKCLLPKISKEISETGHTTFELEYQTRSGQSIPFEISAHRFILEGHPVLLTIGRDITKRKKNDRALRASLAEKEVLLKELHHRVKNNLQVVTSLIDLQSSAISDPKIQEYFLECENRIRSMALVHENLYKSENFSTISAQEYIGTLTEHLVQSSRMPEAITVQCNIDDIALDPDTATSCGFVINELVTNTFKHAFTGKEHGSIIISMKRGPDQSLVLAVADDGIGFPGDINIQDAESLGFQIVSAFARQLHGVLSMTGTNGTTITITFSQKTEGTPT
ncbi:MAG: PAS domain S-box protein [Methanoregula sp.]|nr:PAS domain S-box protein [Methanoregula sp.]